MAAYHVIEHWRTAASAYPRAALDGWAIRSRLQEPGLYAMQTPGSFYYQPDPIVLTTLTEGSRTWFTDEPRQIYALAEIALRAYGTVIVGGLGLGLIHFFLRQNPNVERVITIERGQPLETLVWPFVKHGELIIGDFYEVLPTLKEAQTVITDFLFHLERPETWQELERQRAFCLEHHPGALFLEHGYQRRMDEEVVTCALPPSVLAPEADKVVIFR